MSFVKPSTIQQLAESLAIQNITEDAAKALAPHIDVRLREIIQVMHAACTITYVKFLQTHFHQPTTRERTLHKVYASQGAGCLSVLLVGCLL